MKKKVLILFLLALTAAISILGFTGCGDDVAPEEPEYTIMYSDGESNYTLTVKYGELYSIPKPLPYKEGFRFLGLFDDETGGTQYVSATGMCVAAFSDRRNVVLYPQFAASEFTLVLNYGVGQATNVTSVTVEYGQTVPQLPPDIVATESDKYNFTGWYTQPDCGGKKVADASGVSAVKIETLLDSADESGAIKLYAGFVVKKYKISFYDCKDYTNSWSGFDATPVSSEEVEHGTLIADIAPKTRKNGEKILKWTNSDTGFNSDETVVNRDNNYYVYEYEVTVSFDTAGGAAVSPIKGSNRQPLKLPEKASREYYSFDYWKDSSGTARSGNEYFSCDTTLTACWIRTHYIVTYNVNGGSGVSERHIEIGGDVAFPSTTRQCYEFIGWEYQGKTYKQGDKLEMPSDDITLSAQWKRTHYTVTYDTAGGSKIDEKFVLIGGKVPLPAVTKQCYKFVEWQYLNNSVDPIESIVMPNCDITLTAKWERVAYLVTFDGSDAREVRIGDSITLPKANVNPGYEFNGWIIGNKFYKQNEEFTPDRDVNFKSDYKPLTYVVSLDANGGSVSASNKTVTYDALYSLPVPKKTGYLFVGWYTKTNGGGDKITDDKGSALAKWNKTSDTTLYAAYTQPTCVITLNANGGSVSSTTKSLQYGAMYELPVPTRKDYTFCGWYTSTDSSGRRKTDAKGNGLTTWNEASDITLYAMWTKTYQVEFKRENCQDSKSYNPKFKGNNDAIISHNPTDKHWELIDIYVSGCVKTTDDYLLPEGNSITMSVKVLQNINALPKGAGMGPQLDWQYNSIESDGEQIVYGTNIKGKAIGKGSYYVKIHYTDGTFSESNAIDIFNGKKVNETFNIALDVDNQKKIAKVDVVIVYEIFYQYRNNIFTSTKGWSNWRCTAELNFN